MSKRRNGRSDLRSADSSRETPATIPSEAFAHAYQDRGYDLTVGVLKNSGVAGDAAEESAQAAWVRCLEKREQLRDPRLLLPWVMTATRNAYCSELRRIRRLCTLRTEDLAAASTSDQEAVERSIGVWFIEKLCTPRQWDLLKRVFLG